MAIREPQIRDMPKSWGTLLGGIDPRALSIAWAQERQTVRLVSIVRTPRSATLRPYEILWAFCDGEEILNVAALAERLSVDARCVRHRISGLVAEGMLAAVDVPGRRRQGPFYELSWTFLAGRALLINAMAHQEILKRRRKKNSANC